MSGPMNNDGVAGVVKDAMLGKKKKKDDKPNLVPRTDKPSGRMAMFQKKEK